MFMGGAQRGAIPGTDDVVSGFGGRGGSGGGSGVMKRPCSEGEGLREGQQGDDWPYLRGGEMVDASEHETENSFLSSKQIPGPYGEDNLAVTHSTVF